MSFLDQTGLGTFWAKLKNYFVPKSDTDRPVSKNLINLVTPINLFDNTNFSRSSLSSTVTAASLSHTQRIKIAEGWYLESLGGTWTDITVTIGTNAIVTVTGTLSSIDSGTTYIALQVEKYQIAIPSHQPLTFSYDITDMVNCIAGLSSSGTHSTIIQKLDGVRYTAVYSYSVSDSRNVRMGGEVPTDTAVTGTTISYKLCDPMYYKGSYEHPPYFRSITNESSLPLAVTNKFSSEQFSRYVTSINRNNNVYFRLCKLPKYSCDELTQNTTGDYIKLVVGKGYNSMPQICTIIEVFYLYFGSKIDKATIKATNLITNDARLDAFRITTDGTYYYLETKVHKASFNSEAYRINILEYFNPTFNLLEEKETHNLDFLPSSLSGGGTVVIEPVGWLDWKGTYHEPGT